MHCSLERTFTGSTYPPHRPNGTCTQTNLKLGEVLNTVQVVDKVVRNVKIRLQTVGEKEAPLRCRVSPSPIQGRFMRSTWPKNDLRVKVWYTDRTRRGVVRGILCVGNIQALNPLFCCFKCSTKLLVRRRAVRFLLDFQPLCKKLTCCDSLHPISHLPQGNPGRSQFS